MTVKLKATEIRKNIYDACAASGDECRHCPFRYKCEEHFPYVGQGTTNNDLIPVDYELSKDGKMFVAEV